MKKGKKEEKEKKGVPKRRRRFRPWVTAYRAFGGRIGRIIPAFRDLQPNLFKAGIRISFEAYVSLILLLFIIGFIAGTVGMYLTSTYLLPTLLPSSITLTLGVGLICGLVAFVTTYSYPSIRASGRAGRIDTYLPYLANYMAVLSASGLTMEQILHSLIAAPIAPEVTEEMRTIVRDIDLLGLDTLKALEDASEKTPSKDFSELLRGISETVRSGGELTPYLKKRATWLISQRAIKLREKLETLSLVSEVFVTFAVAAPLIAVVLVTIMGMLGGLALGPLAGPAVIYVVIYAGIPLVSLLILLVISSVLPKRI